MMNTNKILYVILLGLLVLAPEVSKAQQRDQIWWDDRRFIYWYYRYRLLTQFMELPPPPTGQELTRVDGRT